MRPSSLSALPLSLPPSLRLAYWVVFGGTNLLDFFSEFITHWLPFYYLLK